MGYTCGRRLTDELLREIASKFKTRGEFQRGDHSAYTTSREKGMEFLDSICEHMVSVQFSIPQLMCRKILDTLLGCKCLYDTRSVIHPYELDLYYKDFKFAVEYNGKRWHSYETTKEKDLNKIGLCEDLGITLLVIAERSRHYEDDVKTQIIENLELINKVCGKNISEEEVLEVCCVDIWGDVLDYKKMSDDDIIELASKYKNATEFRINNSSLYKYIMKNKKLHLLDNIRTVVNYETKEELLEYAKSVECYSDFVQNHTRVYGKCHKMGILEEASKHMKRDKRLKYINYSDEELLENVDNSKYKNNHEVALVLELERRGIIDDAEFRVKKKRPDEIKARKENRIKLAKQKIDSYKYYHEFEDDVDLYKECKILKILRYAMDNLLNVNSKEFLIEKSYDYNTLDEFMKSPHYNRSLKIKGLTKHLKVINNWEYKRIESKKTYTEKFPETCELLKSGLSNKEIHDKYDKPISQIGRVKREMRDNGFVFN